MLECVNQGQMLSESRVSLAERKLHTNLIKNFVCDVIKCNCSETHINSKAVRKLCIYIYMVRLSPARRYIKFTAMCYIFQRPHEQTAISYGTSVTHTLLYEMYSNALYIPEAA